MPKWTLGRRGDTTNHNSSTASSSTHRRSPDVVLNPTVRDEQAEVSRIPHFTEHPTHTAGSGQDDDRERLNEHRRSERATMHTRDEESSGDDDDGRSDAEVSEISEEFNLRQPSADPFAVQDFRASTPPLMRRVSTAPVLHTRDGDVVDRTGRLAAELESRRHRSPSTAHGARQYSKHLAGWHRFTKKVVSAAGSFDPGSIQIPQHVLHLANALALRDRDRTLPAGKQRRLRHTRLSEFVKHEKDSAVATTRYLV